MSARPATGPLLDVERLGVDYGRVRALRQVSLTLEEGEMALLLGTNGAGKSSFVEALAGLVPVSGGRVHLRGADITSVPAHRRVRRGVSLVPEGRGTLPGLTVAENLDLGWRAVGGRSRGDFRQERERILRLFPALEKRVDSDCSTLSGGEMQMLAIGRALLARPSLLLLDEPSLGLAPKAIVAVHEALRTLSEEGLTMILVEQKALTIDWTPHLTCVLRHGEIIMQARDRRPTSEQLAELYLGRPSKGTT